MTGWKDWQIGEVVTESDFQSFVQDQVVQRYADASARTSALGTAVAEGMVSYLQDTNKVEVYDGTAWTDFSGDITGITAGTGLTGGGTAGDVTLNADYAAIGSAVSITASQVTDITASAAAINTIDDGTAGYTALSNGTAGISYQPVSHNYIINGAFDVWQRGDGPFTTEGVYTSDRWRLSLSGATASVTRQSFTTGELEVASFGNATNYLQLDVTTGDNNCQIQQRLEDVTALAGQEVTISFWAKGVNPGAGAIYLSVFQIFGSGGSANVTATDQPITYTSSWARYTHTFTMPSVSGKTIGTNPYLGITFRQGSGDTSTAAWEFNVWGVQLEAGSVATPFKRHAPSLQGELAACQRYYYQTQPFTIGDYKNCYNGIVPSNNLNSVASVYNFPVPMRAVPTIATYNPNDGSTNTGRMSSVGNVAYSTIALVGERAISQVTLSAVNIAGRDFLFQFSASAEL